MSLLPFILVRTITQLRASGLTLALAAPFLILTSYFPETATHAWPSYLIAKCDIAAKYCLYVWFRSLFSSLSLLLLPPPRSSSILETSETAAMTCLQAPPFVWQSANHVKSWPEKQPSLACETRNTAVSWVWKTKKLPPVMKNVSFMIECSWHRLVISLSALECSFWTLWCTNYPAPPQVIASPVVFGSKSAES